MKIILTAGDPAGIGTDLLVMIAQKQYQAALVAITDKNALSERAKHLDIHLSVHDYHADLNKQHQPGSLIVQHVPASEKVSPGTPTTANANHILACIKQAVLQCLNNEFDAMVTGPVNKAILSDAGHQFTGHTEYIADLCNSGEPVMLLANEYCKVALVTTHLPLHKVSEVITREKLEHVITVINEDFAGKFSIPEPRIAVCGLNPHAGEDGHLGHEEDSIIRPVISRLQAKGINLTGPLPADTAFTANSLQQCDVVLCMYHDQGLPVIKSHGFGSTVNLTLGLPIIRTSVDHGTAFELAGTGKADADSMDAAIKTAIDLTNT